MAVAELVDFSDGANLDELGWGGWLLRQLPKDQMGGEAVRLLELVGEAIDPQNGFNYFLSQLEPIGRDLSTQSAGVRIMSMSASKGLTVNSSFVMGVETGIMPHPRGDENEERRLLYVAMTRATDVCVLTSAGRRTGPTARHGSANVNRPRHRCPFLEDLPIGEWQDGEDFVQSFDGALPAC